GRVLAVGARSRIARPRFADDELDAIQHPTPVILRYLKGLVSPAQCDVESSEVVDPADLPSSTELTHDDASRTRHPLERVGFELASQTGREMCRHAGATRPRRVRRTRY